MLHQVPPFVRRLPFLPSLDLSTCRADLASLVRLQQLAYWAAITSNTTLMTDAYSQCRVYRQYLKTDSGLWKRSSLCSFRFLFLSSFSFVQDSHPFLTVQTSFSEEVVPIQTTGLLETVGQLQE